MGRPGLLDTRMVAVFMTKGHKGYDLLSRVYGPLVKIVYGNTLEKAQSYYLSSLNKDESVLIIGGGNGRILYLLDNLKLSLNVVFLDASKNMLSLASRKKTKNLLISFKHEKYEHYSPVTQHDVILVPFFLDQFEGEELSLMLKKIYEDIRPGGQLILTDFMKTGKCYHLFLEKTMYLFFRAITGTKAGSLSDYFSLAGALGFQKTAETSLMDGFVCSAVLKKPLFL